MFCNNCGKAVDENGTFCGNCGTRVEPKTTPAPAPSPYYGETQAVQHPPVRKSNKGALIGILAAVAVVCALIVTLAFMNADKLMSLIPIFKNDAVIEAEQNEVNEEQAMSWDEESQADADARARREAEDVALADARARREAEDRAADDARARRKAEDRAADDAQARRKAEDRAAAEARAMREQEDIAAAEARAMREEEDRAAAEAQVQREEEDRIAKQAPAQITLASGKSFRVRTSSEISTRRSGKGDGFEATLLENITDGSRVIAERGSTVFGRISDVDASGRTKDVATMSLQIVELTLADGRIVPVRTNTHTVTADFEDRRMGIGARRSGTSGPLLVAPAVVGGGTAITFRLTSPLTVTLNN